MANELDEITGPVNSEGRDINVIEKQIPIKVGVGSKIFEVILWLLAIIPGVIFLFIKINAKKHLSQIQQQLQSAASQIDNYLEQRIVILENAASLVEKSVDLDKETYTAIAGLRSGAKQINDENRNQIQTNIDRAYSGFSMNFENYPDLKAQQVIRDAMQQNMSLQREITAAREVYNDVVLTWNRKVYEWPAYQIVAAKQGYTTRIPFSISQERKQEAKKNFFDTK